jgi:hypothetical protein
MLKRMYGGEDGSTKQELMGYGYLLTNFFGWEEKGKDMLEDDDNYSWAMVDDRIDDAYKEGRLKHVTA